MVRPAPDYGKRFSTVMWLRTKGERDENPAGQTAKAEVNQLLRAAVSVRADWRQKDANDHEVNTE
ncbi:MAG: hypothetical protein ACODAD_13020 [Planctomycetota bacterium]